MPLQGWHTDQPLSDRPADTHQRDCTIDDALIMGADYYETLEECALVPGCLPMGLGESRRLQSALAAMLARLPCQPHV